MVSRTTKMQLIAFDNFLNISHPNFNNNHYYKGSLNGRPFDDWKKPSNQDGNSSYHSSEPDETVYFVRKNQYEAGRANLIIFNWKKSKTVDVDLSEVLSAGDEYELYDVSCLSRGYISKGVYNGKNISVSMELTKVDLPNGDLPNLNEFKHTAPLFGVFVIKRSNASGIQLSAEISGNSSPHENIHLQIQSVYPNPVVDNMTVIFNVFGTSHVHINIIDVSGKSVHSEKLQVVEGINSYSCNLNRLTKGVYMVNISDGLKCSTVKIVYIQ